MSAWPSWCVRRLETKRKDGTLWSVRQMAEQTRLSKSTVHRIWRRRLGWSRTERHFKVSTDPFFVEKVRDIVGLYLNPPENAAVLCVDEKRQIQALERSQHAMPEAPPPSGVSGFSAGDRPQRAPAVGCAYHRGQLRDA
jgi:hypothetical protein